MVENRWPSKVQSFNNGDKTFPVSGGLPRTRASLGWLKRFPVKIHRPQAVSTSPQAVVGEVVQVIPQPHAVAFARQQLEEGWLAALLVATILFGSNDAFFSHSFQHGHLTRADAGNYTQFTINLSHSFQHGHLTEQTRAIETQFSINLSQYLE